MNRIPPIALALILAGGCLASLAAEIERREANNGNVILEQVPEIPESVQRDLQRYQNIRGAGLVDWSTDGGSLFIRTRFAEVPQIHRVDQPGGARRQLTWMDEPVGGASRQPGGGHIAFTMDQGGNEFDQIFLLDTNDGSYRMVSDGESRNGAIEWSPDGKRLAFQSTRRNGRSNDIWIMEADDPDSAKPIVEAPGGYWWGPVAFSRDGNKLLVVRYISANDSRIHIHDLDSGEMRRVAGSAENPSRNFPFDFNADGSGIYYATDRGSEFARLAYLPLTDGAEPEILTGDIDWSVQGLELDDSGKRGAFTVNAGGISRLYLFDPASHEYRVIDNTPTGVIGGLAFRPDGGALAFTANTAQTPNDVYALQLGNTPLQGGELRRWTHSEVGGLDTSALATPELIHYPTFDTVDGAQREIPAFVYRPDGEGPHPVIVSIHGGPESQFRPDFSSTFQYWINELGVAVIAPNVRGSAGYGKSYLKLDNGFKREDSVKDIGALLDWIGEQPDLDGERVGVFGGSYGGYMVLASTVHYSDRLRAAVDVVGISNFVTFLENTEDYRRDLRRPEYGDERDPQMREFLQRISPNNNVDKIDTPLFVIQGQNDPRVPVTESEQMVAALREQGKPVWYMNALNEGHGYARKDNRDLYREAVAMFWRRHLLQ